MVLIFNGVVQKKPPHSTEEFIKANPTFREVAKKFLETPTKVIRSSGLLYVHQGELAVTGPADPNVLVIGSDDATTCIIAVIRHSACGAIALSHMDGTATEDCAVRMIECVKELATGTSDDQLELQLVGAFGHKQRYSEAVFSDLMCSIHQQPENINLTLACVGELNTTVRNGEFYPSVYGIGVNVKNGDLFPAAYPDKGPDVGLRHARQLCGKSEVMEVYNSKIGMLKIGPFDYTPLDNLDTWLQLPDERILRYMSTSPEVEPPHFVSQIRDALKCMKEHPSPADTVFRGNKPRCYVRDKNSNEWILVKE